MKSTMDNQGSRASESPTRTIDSVDSTAMSVETIVDRSATSNVAKTTEKLLQDQSAALANSTNMTNNCNKNSLTNSQISMISNDQKDSHIYSSPDLVTVGKVSKELKEKISMTLEQTLKDKGKRPPVVDKLPVKEDTSVKKRKFPIQILLGILQILLSVTLAALGGLLIARGASLATTGCGLWAGAIAGIAGVLGVINIQNARTGFLAVSLVCVASSTLAMALVGIGLVRDINRLEQEGDENYLRMMLSEVNSMRTPRSIEPENVKQSIKGAISAGSGLIFALVMHFAVSILSVYQSALKLCSRGPGNRQMLENVITGNNASVISQHKVEEYIKNYEQQVKLGSLQHIQKGGKTPTTPENRDKLMALWMNTTGRRGVRSNKSGVPPSPSRTIMLVPAGAGNGMPAMLPPNYCHPAPPPSIIYSPRMMPPGTSVGPQLPYPSLPLPPLPPGSVIHPHDIKTLYRALSPRTASEVSSKRQRQTHRTGKSSANRRQRRKSESDAEFKKAFTYTGLDRAIADSFLERQEATNHSGDTSLTISPNSGKDVAV